VRIALGIFRTHPRGGLEDHALRIAEELIGRGHRVDLHSTGPAPETDATVVSHRRRPLDMTNHARMTTFGADLAAATAGRYDCVVGMQPLPGLDVLFIADHLRNRPDTPLWRRLLPRFRAMVALEACCFAHRAGPLVLGLADTQMQAFADRYPESRDRMVVLPPSIAPDRRNPALRLSGHRAALRAGLGLPGAGTLWLWLGLQPAIKGLDRAIETLMLVPEATLVVAGVQPGHRKAAALRALAAKAGVSERLCWAGYQSGDEVAALLAAADVLAHPARVDVTGAVILEAIINGLPVVATDTCGFAPHVARSGAGVVVAGEDFDTAAFAAALQTAGGPENAVMSANGIAYGETADLYSGLSTACDLIETVARQKSPATIETVAPAVPNPIRGRV
jgi:UDP-glucose:(heptosyl)LPS alpha-1,3-glucosyltransferase